jgi:Transposase zinc-ribbon domain/ISXO2-like transposase domain
MTAVDEGERVEGVEVPGSRFEFESLFGGEAACRAYLERVRWPDGFVCPDDACGGRRSWVTARGLYRCTGCGRQTSATAGTIFAGTHKPLRDWFEVLWLIAGEDGVSAMTVQTALGLGSYQTAWTWLHKVRRAIATVTPEPLTGIVELGVFDLPSVESSARRKSPRPTLVAMALEASDPNTGRVRLARLQTRGSVAVERFISQALAPGAKLRTALKLPAGSALGHRPGSATARARRDVATVLLDDLAGQLDYWIVATHHGAIRRQQLDFYLAEFAFRFNERAGSRSLRFDRLLEAALATSPRFARSLVGGTVAVARALPSGPDRVAG